MSVTHPALKKLKDFIRSFYEFPDAITDKHAELKSFCIAVENILYFGTCYKREKTSDILWNCLSTLDFYYKRHEIPAPVENCVKYVLRRTNVVSGIGRLRLVIRYGLQYKILHSIFSILLRKPLLMNTIYDNCSVMGDDILAEILVSTLEVLKNCHFELSLKNSTFLDKDWVLPEYRIYEFVPCDKVGLDIKLIKGYALVLDVEAGSVADEDIEPGDIIDEIYGQCTFNLSKGKIIQILDEYKRTPVYMNVVKCLDSNDEIFEPLQFILEDANLNPNMLLARRLERLEEVAIENNTKKNLSQDQENDQTDHRFIASYCGCCEVAEGTVSEQIGIGIHDVTAKCQQMKNIALEINVTKAISSLCDTGEILFEHTFTEIVSCGRRVDHPKLFAYVVGDSSYALKKHCVCYVFKFATVTCAAFVTDCLPVNEDLLCNNYLNARFIKQCDRRNTNCPSANPLCTVYDNSNQNANKDNSNMERIMNIEQYVHYSNFKKVNKKSQQYFDEQPIDQKIPDKYTVSYEYVILVKETPLLAVSEQDELFYFVFPRPFLSNNCNYDSTSEFLHNEKHLCTENTNNLQKRCETERTLSASFFYKGYRLLKSPKFLKESVVTRNTFADKNNFKSLYNNSITVPITLWNGLTNRISMDNLIDEAYVVVRTGDVEANSSTTFSRQFSIEYKTSDYMNENVQNTNEGYSVGSEIALLTEEIKENTIPNLKILDTFLPKSDGFCKNADRINIRFGYTTTAACFLEFPKQLNSTSCRTFQKSIDNYIYFNASFWKLSSTYTTSENSNENWIPILYGSKIPSQQVKFENGQCQNIVLKATFEILVIKAGASANPKVTIIGASVKPDAYYNLPPKIQSPIHGSLHNERTYTIQLTVSFNEIKRPDKAEENVFNIILKKLGW
ncbi:Tectonic-2 [Trichinella nativa]|uniref:Tectonic-2 n=1 Tax=Trichinella nativa TaxID=6335 RepID=A0A0V1L2R2_9BILA|nr:Tectonic-2 [Trichinella nativa]